VSSWGDHPPAEVTAIAHQDPDPVTFPPSDPRSYLLEECIQARQEILGVMAGMDDMPWLGFFPEAKICVLDTIHSLRRALLKIEDGIKLLTDVPGKG